LRQRYQYPEPRIAVGAKLLNIANSMLDISDGLAADLNHILEESSVGAKIYAQDLPISKALSHTVASQDALHYALTGGDDYELCFTVPAAKEAQIQKVVQDTGIACTCIGEIISEPGLKVIAENGEEIILKTLGWEFFN